MPPGKLSRLFVPPNLSKGVRRKPSPLKTEQGAPLLVLFLCEDSYDVGPLFVSSVKYLFERENEGSIIDIFFEPLRALSYSGPACVEGTAGLFESGQVHGLTSRQVVTPSPRLSVVCVRPKFANNNSLQRQLVTQDPGARFER